jgi:hypothetical protein
VRPITRPAFVARPASRPHPADRGAALSRESRSSRAVLSHPCFRCNSGRYHLASGPARSVPLCSPMPSLARPPSSGRGRTRRLVPIRPSPHRARQNLEPVARRPGVFLPHVEARSAGDEPVALRPNVPLHQAAPPSELRSHEASSARPMVGSPRWLTHISSQATPSNSRATPADASNGARRLLASRVSWESEVHDPIARAFSDAAGATGRPTGAPGGAAADCPGEGGTAPAPRARPLPCAALPAASWGACPRADRRPSRKHAPAPPGLGDAVHPAHEGRRAAVVDLLLPRSASTESASREVGPLAPSTMIRHWSRSAFSSVIWHWHPGRRRGELRNGQGAHGRIPLAWRCQQTARRRALRLRLVPRQTLAGPLDPA